MRMKRFAQFQSTNEAADALSAFFASIFTPEGPTKSGSQTQENEDWEVTIDLQIT